MYRSREERLVYNKTARRCVESSPSLNAASHCRREKEKRSYRRQQDLRLFAVRFSAGVLYGPDRDPRAAAHTTLSQLAGPADGADENQDQHAADGSRGELQQAKTPQGRLFPRIAGD